MGLGRKADQGREADRRGAVRRVSVIGPAHGAFTQRGDPIALTRSASHLDHSRFAGEVDHGVFPRCRTGKFVRYTTRFSAIADSTDCTPGIRITTPRRNVSNDARSAATTRIR